MIAEQLKTLAHFRSGKTPNRALLDEVEDKPVVLNARYPATAEINNETHATLSSRVAGNIISPTPSLITLDIPWRTRFSLYAFLT